jgi:hypothetical protein
MSWPSSKIYTYWASSFFGRELGVLGRLSRFVLVAVLLTWLLFGAGWGIVVMLIVILA